MDVSLTDLFKVVAGILGSIAGGGVIVAGFAKWVGGIYANRLVEALKAKYARELEGLRNTYAGELEGLKSSLATSQKQLQATLDRISHVQRIQFETEFKALSSIWEKVAGVETTMQVLRPRMKVMVVTADPQKNEELRKSEFAECLKGFIAAYHSNFTP
jgi:Skp family chaperone for outer membrane proteins